MNRVTAELRGRPPLLGFAVGRGLAPPVRLLYEEYRTHAGKVTRVPYDPARQNTRAIRKIFSIERQGLPLGIPVHLVYIALLRGWRGRAPRQPGQVRKEAAVTSPAWVVVQPLTDPSEV